MGNDLTVQKQTESREISTSASDFMQMVQATLPKVEPEKLPALLTSLFEFQLKVDARNAEAEFNKAFALAKAEMPRVKKNGKIDMGAKGEMSFAEYEDVDAAVRPVEEKHGFARSFQTSPAKDGIAMTLVMRHSAGHVDRTSAVEMPPDTGAGRNMMQARRSATSYAKRGLTLDYWDIITVKADNDGSTAEPLSQDQQDTLKALLDEVNIKPDDKTFLKWAEAPSFSGIQRIQYERIIRGLEQKRRQA